jgi:hypothetical protein
MAEAGGPVDGPVLIVGGGRVSLTASTLPSAHGTASPAGAAR